MKLRSLELRNFRKFVGAVRVDGIGDGLSILAGPNEYGKSTLLEAINGVIFEKATSQNERVRGFRHFVDGTVPEVELGFDLDETRWTVHKRFGGPSGKALLTDTSGHRFEGDAAETELQKLLGFTRGPRNSEPGIWGTLWVQQGKSFPDTNLDEFGRRNLQGCLEAQVGIVTGGQRGQIIPTAVERALTDIKSMRGPRGKFKDAIDRLAQTRTQVAQREAKCNEIFGNMDELARLRRDRQRSRADWDEDAHRVELSEMRDRRTSAATKAAEISAARSAAKLAEDRADRAQREVTEREALIAELGPLGTEVGDLEAKFTEAEARQTDVKRQLDAAEERLVQLRHRQRDNGEKARRLDRVRAAQIIASEIEDHKDTLKRAAALRIDVGRLIEAIGANPATDENVSRIEDATAELAGARAAVNAVATTVSFALDPDGAERVRLDGYPLLEPVCSVPIVTRTTIAIYGIGEITVAPQIADRETMIERVRSAEDELRTAVEAAGAPDLPAARRSAAQRRDLVRQLTIGKQEIGGLAPADRARRLPAGLEARENRISELQGRLAKEIEMLGLASLPPSFDTEEAIATLRGEDESISREIDAADTAVEEPKQLLAAGVEGVQDLGNQLAGLRATVAGKQNQLAAGRSRCRDEDLSAQAEKQAGDAVTARTALAALEREQGETVDEIDVRIKRLEAASRQHAVDIEGLSKEITRLEAWVEANEGVGVEEDLDAARAEETWLETRVRAYEEDVVVLALLLDTLRGAESEAKRLYLAPVAQRAEPYLRTLLPGAGLVFDEDLSINAIERSGAAESFVRLSAGTQEQLAVLTRLAFAELLLDQGRPATVILDDALVFSDDDRMERMFDILMRAGEKVQIIVLTCRRRLFARLGAPTLQISASGGAA